MFATLERRMDMPTKTSFELIKLSPQIAGRVQISDASRQHYILTMDQAVKACHAYNSQYVFSDQFDSLLAHLVSWCSNRKEVVSRGIMTVRDNGILFVLVQKNLRLDANLESDVSDLMHEIINDSRFSLIRLEVLSLPSCDPEEVTSFVDPKVSFELDLNAK
jgi:hypothetical protein